MRAGRERRNFQLRKKEKSWNVARVWVENSKNNLQSWQSISHSFNSFSILRDFPFVIAGTATLSRWCIAVHLKIANAQFSWLNDRFLTDQRSWKIEWTNKMSRNNHIRHWRRWRINSQKLPKSIESVDERFFFAWKLRTIIQTFHLVSFSMRNGYYVRSSTIWSF